MTAQNTIPFGGELTAYGENLTDSMALPKTTATATDSKRIGGAMGAVELVVIAKTAVAATTLTVAVEESDDNATWSATGWTWTGASVSKAADGEIARFCVQSKSKPFVRGKVSSDSGATGNIAVNVVHLPR